MPRVTLAVASDQFPNGSRVLSVTSGDVTDTAAPFTGANAPTNVSTATTITPGPGGVLPVLAQGATLAGVWPGYVLG